MIVLFMILPFVASTQEGALLNTFENREELRHIIQLSNNNYLLSGKTSELTNKSDLVILLDRDGKELSRAVVCDDCITGDIVFSKETDNDSLLHVRTTGELYLSDMELTETELVYNIKDHDPDKQFESVEVYEVLQNKSYIIVVSYAVQGGVRGLLHTTIDTRDNELISQKFNTLFPDISGSIGIGLFNDVGVIDGYNEDLGGQSIGHLLRYSQQRDLVWETALDWGDIQLNNVLVAFNQSIYAVGTIRDEDNPDHIQGLIVHYDGEGNLIWEKRFDSPFLEDENYDTTIKNFSRIEQIQANLFVVTGLVGGERSSDDFSKAYVLRINRDGEYLEEFTTEVLTERVEAVDVVRNKEGEIVVLGNAFSFNGIAGSFLSISQNTNSAYDVLPSNINVYPNPAEDFLIIESSEFEVEKMAIRVYDLSGNLTLEQIGEQKIDISELPSGVYVMTIYSNQGTYRVQFVKN